MLYTHHFHCSTGHGVNLKRNIKSKCLHLSYSFGECSFKYYIVKSVILQNRSSLTTKTKTVLRHGWRWDEAQATAQSMRKPHRAAWLYASLLSKFLQVQIHPQSFRDCSFINAPTPHLNAPPFYLLDIHDGLNKSCFRNHHRCTCKWKLYRIGPNDHSQDNKVKHWIYKNNPPRPLRPALSVLAPYWWTISPRQCVHHMILVHTLRMPWLNFSIKSKEQKGKQKTKSAIQVWKQKPIWYFFFQPLAIYTCST